MQKNGFTLIELICVIAIIAIATSIAMPNISNWLDKEALNTSARQIAVGIRKTRQLAMTTNRETKFELYRDGKYKIRDYDVRRPSLETVELSKRVNYISSNFNDNFYNIDVVGFNVRGRPTYGGTITLRANKEELNITVLPVTGRVKIK